MRQYVLSLIAWLLYRLLSASWRKSVIEHASVTRARRQGRPCVFAHWHGDELALVHMVGRLHIVTMTSRSADGRRMDFVIRKLGARTVTGSSSHGGVQALKGLVRHCRSGCNASMAVDGPRGPRHVVKPGVIHLAQLSGGVIVPVGVACSKRHVFEKSWNRAVLPWPFARVIICFGPTQEIHASRPPDRALAIETLNQALDDVHEQARRTLTMSR
ncbi:lipoprotein [Salinisphaera sp. PC39]|uniref:lysophospholipid acyltransferase family protein n=1 Tax=Salinisphaera sp. PC39 TaxID=1304156 RepID=UPI0033426A29